jgi:hypothetical protein
MKMAMWKMKDETKQGFDQLADQYGFSKQLFADIALEILRQTLAKNPKIELTPSENNGTPKVIISEPAA